MTIKYKIEITHPYFPYYEKGSIVPTLNIIFYAWYVCTSYPKIHHDSEITLFKFVYILCKVIQPVSRFECGWIRRRFMYGSNKNRVTLIIGKNIYNKIFQCFNVFQITQLLTVVARALTAHSVVKTLNYEVDLQM